MFNTVWRKGRKDVEVYAPLLERNAHRLAQAKGGTDHQEQPPDPPGHRHAQVRGVLGAMRNTDGRESIPTSSLAPWLSATNRTVASIPSPRRWWSPVRSRRRVVRRESMGAAPVRATQPPWRAVTALPLYGRLTPPASTTNGLEEGEEKFSSRRRVRLQSPGLQLVPDESSLQQLFALQIVSGVAPNLFTQEIQFAHLRA